MSSLMLAPPLGKRRSHPNTGVKAVLGLVIAIDNLVVAIIALWRRR
jgi:hypothetical protein